MNWLDPTLSLAVVGFAVWLITSATWRAILTIEGAYDQAKRESS